MFEDTPSQKIIAGNPQLPELITHADEIAFPKFKKIIIDTDAGGDDAHALLLAFHMIRKYKLDTEIIGITCVSGNTHVENVVKNVRICIELSNLEVKPPVYKGCHNDILRKTFRDNFFGADGLGGVQQEYLQKLGLADLKFEDFFEKQHAADFIIDSAKKYGKDLCIITLAPLTNIFLAQQLYPRLVQEIGGLSVMGGTYLGFGNTPNFCGEFNFYNDVEAAFAVITQPYNFCSIMTFDLVVGLKLSGGGAQAIFYNDFGHAKADFITKLFKNIFVGPIAPFLCDQMTVMLTLMPDLITTGLNRNVTICKDGYARGQMIVDWLHAYKSEQMQNNCIITGLDQKRIEEIAESLYQ